VKKNRGLTDVRECVRNWICYAMEHGLWITSLFYLYGNPEIHAHKFKFS